MSQQRALPQVLMFSRQTCGLCDKARAIIEAERGRTPFEFDEVWIDGDDALEDAHGLRVPVVEIDGRERLEYEVDPEELLAIVRGG